jgi:hypothetical protein
VVAFFKHLKHIFLHRGTKNVSNNFFSGDMCLISNCIILFSSRDLRSLFTLGEGGRFPLH